MCDTKYFLATSRKWQSKIWISSGDWVLLFDMDRETGNIGFFTNYVENGRINNTKMIWTEQQLEETLRKNKMDLL